MNREADTLSVLVVHRSGVVDVLEKLAEVPVGLEPRCVALGAREREAYVTNAASGTVSVVALAGAHANHVIAEMTVGPAPRGCAATANGTRLFVASYTAGTVAVIDTARRSVVRTVEVGGSPVAVAVTDDGDSDDDDETVIVSQFFAEPVPGGPGERFDDARQGVVQAFSSTGTGAVTDITLAPRAASGRRHGGPRQPRLERAVAPRRVP